MRIATSRDLLCLDDRMDYVDFDCLLSGDCIATNSINKMANHSNNKTKQRQTTTPHRSHKVVSCCQRGSQLKSNKLANHKRCCSNNILIMMILLLATLSGGAWAAPSTTAATQSTLTPTSISSNGSIRSVQASSSNQSGNNNTGNTRLRKRHSKRHSNWYDYYNYNENSTILEWANPCGGYYDPTQLGGAEFAGMRRMKTKEIFNLLKRSVGNEFKTLNGSQQDIDISNIKIWSLHEYTYKFLPKLKMNSSIALKRWYRNTQTYVASFAYLRRIQLKWDHMKRQRESRTSRELKHLLLSSRSILCELETAINSTRPHQQQKRRNQQPGLHMISRQQMNKRLKLRTKRRYEKTPDALYEADTIDLKFVKHFYYEFLETMWKVLRKNMKRRGQIALRGPNNRKEFNEVEKNFGSIAASRKEKRRQRRLQRKQRHAQHRARQQQALRKPQIKTTTATIETTTKRSNST